MSQICELNNNEEKEEQLDLNSKESEYDEDDIGQAGNKVGEKEMKSYTCAEETKDKELVEVVDLLSPLQSKVCFICREKKLQLVGGGAVSVDVVDCKTCHNIRLYHSKKEVQHQLRQRSSEFEENEDDEEKVNVPFPGPGIVRRNHIYGNYVVAERTIEEGELIISEQPLTVGPYSPPDILPLCLSCCKDIGLSSRCSKCKWPVCGEECEKFYLHADNECSIFAKCGIKSKMELSEYFTVEVLRAILLREKNHDAWKRILDFEPHIQARAGDYKAKAMTDFIVNFIRNRCRLSDQISAEIIDHVVGVLSVNTFWAFNDLNRYASCLFDKITLFAHDCDPNTTRKLVFLEDSEETNLKMPLVNFKEFNSSKISSIALQVTAARKIRPGEMITIRYINLDQSLSKRREELKETFYFDCTCSRCLHEISEREKQIELDLSTITVN